MEHFSSVLPTKVIQRRSKDSHNMGKSLGGNFQALSMELGPFLGHFPAFLLNRNLSVTIFLGFPLFTKSQIRFPLKNHEIGMGTCLDVLYLSTKCYKNHVVYRASQNVKIGFHCNA